VNTKTITEWLDTPEPTSFPYDAVLSEYLNVGKHFVSDDTLKSLTGVRDWLETVTPARAAEWAELNRFLVTALDKWDGRYDYATYIALDVLNLPGVAQQGELAAPAMFALPHRDRLVVQLIADALGFELAVTDGRTALLPELRPDAATVAKRHRLALRVARPALDRLGLALPPAELDPEAAARHLCATVDGDLSEPERRVLRQSMQPVYVAHDEYLFLRVLQLFETTFAMLAVQLRKATAAMGAGGWRTAVAALEASEVALRESAPLFSLLATMQVESFRTFRVHTEGASAIQSRNYKIVEALCRRPDADRLDSMAYRSVPDVRERVLAGQQTLDDVFAAARAAGDLPAEGEAALTAAMRAFSDTLLRWRQTHYRLAVRMLGERPGTGYTEGTPYLKSVRTIPVFRSVTSAEEGDTNEPV
jgi:tryptophan 2,3-dioxygenase